MAYTRLAIIDPFNCFADMLFSLTFDTVNVKTDKTTINLAVNGDDDGAAAWKLLVERERRMWRNQGGDRVQREGVWFD